MANSYSDAVFAVDVVLNDEEILAAVERTVAGLEQINVAANKGNAGSTARHSLVQSGANLAIVREKAQAAGVSAETLGEMDAAMSLVETAYVSLAGEAQKTSVVENEFRRARTDQVKRIKSEDARRRTAEGKGTDLGPEGDELSPRDRVLKTVKDQAYVADLKATDPEITNEVIDAQKSRADLAAQASEQLAEDTVVLANQHRELAAITKKRLALAEATLIGENELLETKAQEIAINQLISKLTKERAAEILAAAGLGPETPEAQSLRDTVVEKDTRAADVAEVRATDPEALDQGLRSAEAARARSATMAEELAESDTALAASHRRLAALAKERLGLAEATLAGDNEILDTKIQEAVVNKQIATITKERANAILKSLGLAAAPPPPVPLTTKVVEGEQRRADVAEIKATDPQAIEASNRATLAARERSANTAEEMAESDEALAAQHRRLAALGRERLGLAEATLAGENEILETKAQEIATNKQIAIITKQRADAILKSLGLQPVQAPTVPLRDQVVAGDERRADVAEIRSTDTASLAAAGRSALAAKERQAILAEEAAESDESVAATARRLVAQGKERVAINEAALAGENDLIETKAQERAAAAEVAALTKQRANQILRARGIGGPVNAVQIPLAAQTLQKETKRADVAELKVTDPAIVAEGDRAAAAAAQRRAQQAAVLAKSDEAIGAAHLQEASASQTKLALLRRTLAGENDLLNIQAQTLVAAKEVQAAERQLAKATLEQAVKSGQLGRGSLVQRIQANVANRQGGALRAPTEFASGRQLALGSLITTGRFALSGGLLYGGIQGITKTIQAAQELEKILNQVRRQFESLGKAGEFQGFSEAMLRIGRDTGNAAAEVATVGFQLQGAFGGDTARAIRETEAAFQAVRVTGLSITEVIDAFTALTQNFDAVGVSIQDVSDTALGLQERFGVLAKETISFAADLAPVAAQAGFTVQQLEALGAVGQKYSGRSGSNLAEAFGRILPSIQSNAVEFLNLFDQLGQEDLSNQVAEAFSTGNIADFFQILLRSYSDLSGAQKNYVIELLGGRREAQSLIPILENSGELLNEFANAQTDAGKTSQYFGDLQKTLAQQLDEFGQELSQLGIKLLNSGITDFFEDIIRLAGSAIDVLNILLGVLDGVGSAIGSIPGLGGGLGSLLEGIVLYKGIGLLGNGIKGKLGLGAAAAGSAGSTLAGKAVIPGVPGVVQLGAQTAAARAMAGAAGKTGVAAFAGGLEGVFAGFNWVGLGITVGALVLSELSSGVQKQAAKTITGIEQSDNKPGFNDQELGQLGNEFGNETVDFSGLAENYRTAARVVQGDAGDIKTIADLRKAMAADAKSDASVFQLGLDAVPFSDLSKDVLENKAAAGAALDEHKKRLTDFFTSIAEDDEVLNQLSRERLEGTPLEGNKEAIGKGASAIRDDLNDLISKIADESADPNSVAAVVAALTTQVPAAKRAIANRLREEQEQITRDAVAVLDADQAIAGYESGDVGLAQARSAIAAAISGRERLGYASGTADQQVELAKLIKRQKEFQSEILLREAEALTEGVEGFNTSTPQTRLSTITNLLKSGRLTPGDQRKATEMALNALKDVHQARLDAADTAAEEAKILAEGTPVPQELQVELVYQYLSNASVAFQDFISTTSNGIVEVGNAITRTAAEIFAKGGVTIQDAVRQSIVAQVNTIKALRDKVIEGLGRAVAIAGGGYNSIDQAVAFYNGQIASLEGGLQQIPKVDVPDYSNYGVDAEGAAKKAKDAAKEAAEKAHAIRLAQLDVYKAMIEGDPVAEANIDARIAQENAAFARATGDREGQLAAQAAAIRAARAREEALAEIAAAKNDLGLAKRGDDPVGSAFVELISANEALRLARGTAARIHAQAQQVRARKALAEAIQDIGLAQLELVQAIAAAAGDSVGAARKALEIAKQQLANVKKNSPKDQAAILRAQADVVSSEASLRDADLSERERAIDVALQLEQITVGQAIAQLQALLTIPKLTKEQTDAILLKIKSLKDELGGDFKFNLPTGIALPTAYEVSRLSQTPDGSGYNDNRVQTVNVYAETNATPEAIATAVVDAVGQPNRTGTVPKKY